MELSLSTISASTTGSGTTNFCAGFLQGKSTQGITLEARKVQRVSVARACNVRRRGVQASQQSVNGAASGRSKDKKKIEEALLSTVDELSDGTVVLHYVEKREAPSHVKADPKLVQFLTECRTAHCSDVPPEVLQHIVGSSSVKSSEELREFSSPNSKFTEDQNEIIPLREAGESEQSESSLPTIDHEVTENNVLHSVSLTEERITESTSSAPQLARGLFVLVVSTAIAGVAQALAVALGFGSSFPSKSFATKILWMLPALVVLLIATVVLWVNGLALDWLTAKKSHVSPA